MNHDQALDVNERVRLMRDGVINYSGTLVSGVVGILLIPVMLRGLGAESYGLWITALAVKGMVQAVDFGLSYSITREVGASLTDVARDQTARFVVTAGNAYIGLGIVGAIFIGTLGLPISEGLRLSIEGRQIAPLVFGLVGLAYFTDQLLVIPFAVLAGLRQFGAINLISIAVVVLRAIGIVVLLGAGAALTTVALWEIVVSASTVVAVLAVVGKIEPRYRLRLGRIDWGALRSHVPFSITSQLVAVAGSILWQTTPVLIGMARGTSSVVPYHIGQRFPYSISVITWNVGEVFFPAASENERSQNIARMREILEVSTRWVILFVSPVCIALWIVAPNLLQAWLNATHPDSVLVLQITTAAVLTEAVGVGALQVLWGRGEALTILIVLSGAIVAGLGLSLALLPLIGIAGGAWGLLLAMTFSTCASLYFASRRCGTRISDLLRVTSRGLLLPSISCAMTVFGLMHIVNPGKWATVIGCALAGGMVYAASLYLGGAREEERIIAREAIELPATTGRFLYQRLRGGRFSVYTLLKRIR